MAQRGNRWTDKLVQRAALRRWRRVADVAPEVSLSVLRDFKAQALALKQSLDSVLHQADHRLALPVIGNHAFRRPLGTDWSWRPMLWTGRIPVPGLASVPGKAEIAPGSTLFHDCRRSELTVRQIRNSREVDLAPFGLRMDVLRFDGSFLSLVLDLPDAAAQGLKLNHLIRLDAVVELEKPLEIFVRLNLKHGPNVEQVVRELPMNSEEVMVEFDLAYTKMNEKRIEKVWVDMIFEGPEMNQIILRDVTMSRRPRAEL
ncbi:MAG: DUF6478 family protein [Pseudorhodobacter sp.]|nr:DUF6478 family protein [Pseudorhodobacter sp.]